jgi:hypothetical protein
MPFVEKNKKPLGDKSEYKKGVISIKLPLNFNNRIII